MCLRRFVGSNKSELSSDAEAGYVPSNHAEGSVEFLKKYLKMQAMAV